MDIKGMEARALFDFESGGGTELTFQQDEMLTIVRQDVGEGWWEARNSRGETGLIPEAYVELASMPEPKIPPPPPPTTYLSQQKSATPPPETPAWSAPQQQATAPPIPNTWNNSPPSHTPPAVRVNDSYPPPPADPPRQDSYEDWDDDWDDDDSSTTTETPSDFGGGNFGLALPSRERSSDKDGSKFGTVKKSFNRFSAFSKQGGDAFLFGTATVIVPDSEKVLIIETDEGPMWKTIDHPFTCVVASPKKETKFHGMKSYIAYQLTPSFSNIQVSRRYKHFDWLHERLVEKYSTVVIPPLPDKQISGRYEEDFIQERMRQLQQWIDRMCQHPALAHSDVLNHFLSCTDEKKWKQGKRKAEKDEFQGGKFFLTLETPASPCDQKDVENGIERFSRFVKSMDDSVRHLFNVGESNMKKHQGPFKKEYQKLGNSFISLARSFDFDERESSLPLTTAVEHTGKTYDEIGKLYEQQPRHDMQMLLESLQEYKGILQVFPDVLSVHRAASQKMEESYTRLSESEIQSAQGRVDVISYSTLAEINQFNQYRCGDFKKMMQTYLRGQIEFYSKITQLLQGTLSQYDHA